VINLSSCAVAQGGLDGAIGNPVQLTTDFLVFPGDYVVLTPDPITLKLQYNVPNPTQVLQLSLPSLDDKTGSLALVSNGYQLDRLDYSEDWHYGLLSDKNGVSLERVSFVGKTQDANNWHSAASSVGFATPTYKNSQAVNHANMGIDDGFVISPDVISPDGDGDNDFCLMSYLTAKTDEFTVNITVFDANGRFVKTLAQGQLLGNGESIQWDGTTALGQKAGIGYYIVAADLFSANGTVHRYKKTVVVAAKL
jgi:FlgD Ig-like domain